LKRFLSALNYHILSNPLIWISLAAVAAIIAISLWMFFFELKAEYNQVERLSPLNMQELSSISADQLVLLEGTISPENATPIDDYAVYQLIQRKNRLDRVLEAYTPDLWIQLDQAEDELKLVGPYQFSTGGSRTVYEPATVTENAVLIDGIRVHQQVIVLATVLSAADHSLQAQSLFLGDRSGFLVAQSATINRAFIGALSSTSAALLMVGLAFGTWRRYLRELRQQQALEEQEAALNKQNRPSYRRRRKA
jgi:ABC-type nickel/cobalt efflux system permease component RcnA